MGNRRVAPDPPIVLAGRTIIAVASLEGQWGDPSARRRGVPGRPHHRPSGCERGPRAAALASGTATQGNNDDGGDDLYYSIEIDWCRCPLLESVPGKVSGAWVIKGTRMPAQAIIDNYDSGLDAPEIAEAFEQDPRLVEAVVAFADEYRAEARGRVLASPEFVALLDGAPPPPQVDWSGCGVVEWMAGPAHGTWVLRGTPTPADLLMGHHDPKTRA